MVWPFTVNVDIEYCDIFLKAIERCLTVRIQDSVGESSAAFRKHVLMFTEESAGMGNNFT